MGSVIPCHVLYNCPNLIISCSKNIPGVQIVGVGSREQTTQSYPCAFMVPMCKTIRSEMYTLTGMFLHAIDPHFSGIKFKIKKCTLSALSNVSYVKLRLRK